MKAWENADELAGRDPASGEDPDDE